MMNLKKVLFPGVLFLLLAFGAQAQKIGYTNIELLMAYMPETQSISKQLENVSAALQKPIKIKEDYYQMKMMEYYEIAQSPNGFPAGEQQSREQELAKLEQEIQGAMQGAEQQLLGKQNELMYPIMQRIQDAINAVAEEEGFVYILNQTSGNNILYGVETLNVTKKLAGKLGIKIEE